ncbi:hypothetical protein RhiirA4_466999 [Rhizophagus irregularis]|uniref:Phosphatidylserine decarboxylase n=1 Tax=Rhizophagus irregularis TaxID=588596 RepID=A0A2I1GV22_9GLOM|nr:hypothetical protein RhiirA4_466999 [Rhizophagus irregularis]
MTEQSLGPFPCPKTPNGYQPIVKRLKDMIECNNWKDKFEQAVYDAQKTGVENMTNISCLTDYYNFLNYLVLWVPKENETGTFTFYTAENYNVDSYVVPQGGWLGHSFNEFFARKFLPGTRPIDGPSNPAIIVSAADSTFDGCCNINTDSIVYLKGLPWTIGELLADSKYSNDFAGGKFMHAFLAPYDYHRQHAPVDGKVLEAKVIPGQTYLEVNVKKNFNGKHRLIPTALDAPDSAGYQLTVSSVVLCVKGEEIGKDGKVVEGDEVKKGDEISYFQFGGSDIVLLFQAQSKVKILADIHKHYRVGEQIAIAHIAE